jgi:hypothetical protein
MDMHLDDLHRDMVLGVFKVAKCGLDLMSVTGEWKWNTKLVYAKIVGILIVDNLQLIAMKWH